jgi:hypothetical protein
MHDRDLPSRPAETKKGDAQSGMKRLTKTPRGEGLGLIFCPIAGTPRPYGRNQEDG